MKTKLASILVLAAAFCASYSTSLHAAPKNAEAHAVRVRVANFNGWEISRDTPAQTMINRFGAPNLELSDNVWVYERFHSVQNRKPANQCDTLIVTLIDGVVADLHLVNDRAQTIIAARVQSGAPAIVASAE